METKIKELESQIELLQDQKKSLRSRKIKMSDRIEKNRIKYILDTVKKINPFTSPINISRLIDLREFDQVSCFMAIARTAVVKDWVPEQPPIEATTGIRAAKMARFAIVFSKFLIMNEAKKAAKRLKNSQVNLAFVTFKVAP